MMMDGDAMKMVEGIVLKDEDVRGYALTIRQRTGNSIEGALRRAGFAIGDRIVVVLGDDRDGVVKAYDEEVYRALDRCAELWSEAGVHSKALSLTSTPAPRLLPNQMASYGDDDAWYAGWIEEAHGASFGECGATQLEAANKLEQRMLELTRR